MPSGGPRANAGRKCHLEDKTIQDILRLSAANIIRAFRSKEIPLQFKAELGKHFVLKKIPTVINSDGTFAPKTIILMRPDEQPIAIENRVENLIDRDA